MTSEPLSSADPCQHTDRNDRLFSQLYRELRHLAQRALQRTPGGVISPTTVLHEAYLDISARDPVFPDRERFLGYAARVMRGVIIDLVRERCAIKRGGAYEITQLPEDVAPDDDDPQLARMSDALDELAGREPGLAELVDLKYFCGFTFEEIAQQRQVSVRTVQRDWRKVRLILFSELAAR